jgi:hypothetical protein
MNDPEFIERSVYIHKWIDDGDDNHITLGHDNGKISMIIGDQNIRKIGESEIEDINKLAADFDISIPEAVSLLNGYGIVGKGSVRVEYSKYETTREPNGITIHVGKGATKQEIVRAIADIDDLIEFVFGESVRKDKGPENPKLIYAVHIARHNGMKFKDIFEHYQNKTLDRYNGSASIGSIEKLKQYYYKYRPHSALPYPITPENAAEAVYILQPELKKSTT